MKTKKIIILVIAIVLGLSVISAGIGYVLYRNGEKRVSDKMSDLYRNGEKRVSDKMSDLYRDGEKRVSDKMSDLQSKFFQYALPARKKLLSLCSKDYDTTKLARAFDKYIEAFKTKSIREHMITNELAPYLLQSLEDGTLSAEEADSLTVLFEKSVKK